MFFLFGTLEGLERLERLRCRGGGADGLACMYMDISLWMDRDIVRNVQENKTKV